MLRWMTGVSLSERKSNECVRSMLAIDDITEVMRRNRLRWFDHVERRDELCWIKRIETLQVDGNGVKGRPRKSWREVLREDTRNFPSCLPNNISNSCPFVHLLFTTQCLFNFLSELLTAVFFPQLPSSDLWFSLHSLPFPCLHGHSTYHHPMLFGHTLTHYHLTITNLFQIASST